MGCIAARPVRAANQADSPKELSVADPSSDRSRATGLSDSPLECAMHKSLSSRRLSSNPAPHDLALHTDGVFIGIVVPGAAPSARFDNVGLWWMFVDEATRLDSADSDTGEIEQRAFTAALLLRAHLIRTGQMPRVIAPAHATDHAMECMVMEAARMADLRADPDGWCMHTMVEVRATAVDKLTYYADDPATMPAGWKKADQMPDETIFNRIHATSRATLAIPQSHAALSTADLNAAMSELAEYIAETNSK